MSYRERASEAEVLAHRARTERERAAFKEIARIWRRLAGDELDAAETAARTSGLRNS